MEYIVKGKLTKKDYTNFNRAALIHKKSYFFILIICLLCVFSGTVSSIIKNPRIENIIAQIMPIIIIFSVYFVVFKIFRNYSFNSDKTLKDEITLTLTESGINYASFRGSFNYTVGDFRKIIINKHLIAIYISFSKAILIPKHFFNSKEEENEVELFIKENYLNRKK